MTTKVVYSPLVAGHEKYFSDMFMTVFFFYFFLELWSLVFWLGGGGEKSYAELVGRFSPVLMNIPVHMTSAAVCAILYAIGAKLFQSYLQRSVQEDWKKEEIPFISLMPRSEIAVGIRHEVRSQSPGPTVVALGATPYSQWTNKCDFCEAVPARAMLEPLALPSVGLSRSLAAFLSFSGLVVLCFLLVTLLPGLRSTPLGVVANPTMLISLIMMRLLVEFLYGDGLYNRFLVMPGRVRIERFCLWGKGLVEDFKFSDPGVQFLIGQFDLSHKLYVAHERGVERLFVRMELIAPIVERLVSDVEVSDQLVQGLEPS